MESTELMANPQTAEMLETVLVNGDLSQLAPQQRLDYYRQVCESMGLNPLSRPFDYITLNGKLTLYAKKDATDQLRKIHGVNIDDIQQDHDGDLFIVTVKGSDRAGRRDVEVGIVNKNEMGRNIGNAMMKAVTKAKRRLTLSLCGLGWLDETEVETIPNAKLVTVDDAGNIAEQTRIENKAVQNQKPINTAPSGEKPAEAQKRPFNEDEFLASFSKPNGIPDIDTKAAQTYTDSNDKPYKDMLVKELYVHWMGLAKQMKSQNQAEAELTAMKIGAICRILQDKKISKQIKAPNGGRPDPFVPGAE